MTEDINPEELLASIGVGASEEKQDRFEISVLKKMFEAFDIPYYLRRELSEYDDVQEMFAAVRSYVYENKGRFPWEIRPFLVPRYNFLDLFLRPTKCPIVQAWNDICNEIDLESGTTPVMPFKVNQFGVVVATIQGCGIDHENDATSITVPRLRGTHPMALYRLNDWVAYARGYIGLP